ncbi:MAG: ABC transporter ATP-binding protein [Gemmataceae bacterium]
MMAEDARQALQVHDLCKDFPSADSEPLSVLRSVNLEIGPGESLVVMGPSGSGKSTLLHILGTLDKPTSGTVTLAGANPFELSEHRLADFRNKHIGFIFQDHHLLPQCTVLENVLIPTLAGESNPGASEAYAKELIERVGLTSRIDHRPARLSGGERQRVAVARALIRKPALVLADEPTGNLDRNTAKAIGELLMEMHQQENNILVIVTHSMELAQSFPKRLEMVDGRLADSEN